VVVPLLDEASTVDALVARVRGALESRVGGFELVLVDDGSRDGTAARLRALEADDPRLRVFELTRNFGQMSALACGLFAARGDVVVTMDADLQNPPEEIPKLLDAIDKGAFVATARRAQRYEHAWRWLGSRFVHALGRVLTGADIRDFGGQFKAYRREVVEALGRVWAPGKPLFPLALWLGYPVAEVDVRHDPRAVGESRYGLAALVRINLDLVTSFSTLPLALLGGVGVLALALGAIGLALCAWLEPAGWLAPATALLVFGLGGTWSAAGVLGLYLGRIYQQVSRTAAFAVQRGPLRDGAAEAGAVGEPRR
jgi:undecaprenyl-phosphate 4-deoxy-4-formamido-L-arabinose transferase